MEHRKVGHLGLEGPRPLLLSDAYLITPHAFLRHGRGRIAISGEESHYCVAGQRVGGCNAAASFFDATTPETNQVPPTCGKSNQSHRRRRGALYSTRNQAIHGVVSENAPIPQSIDREGASDRILAASTPLRRDTLVSITTGPPPVSNGGFAGALTRAVASRLDSDTLRAAHRRLHVKAIIIAVWYLSSFVGVILSSGWLQGIISAVSLSLAFAAVGFNIQHDANHNAFFATTTKRLSRANRIVGWSMFVVGADANRWLYRHNTLHHGSPNVVGTDSDINLGPLARLAPFQRRYFWHRYQHIYLWPLYCFTVLEIMFNDLGTLVGASRHARKARNNLSDASVAVLTKVGFAAVMLGLPSLTHPFWIVALGALTVMLTVGFLLAVVFQSAHVVEGAEFAEAGSRPPYQWHEWQVRSSLDFSHGSGPLSRLFRWYAGGLDHQTEHHLFPRVPHTAYPLIAPVVSAVCTDFGIPRYIQPSFHAAVASHFRHIRAMGRPLPRVSSKANDATCDVVASRAI
jgi:linoleoyl-CoA desaturase